MPKYPTGKGKLPRFASNKAIDSRMPALRPGRWASQALELAEGGLGCESQSRHLNLQQYKDKSQTWQGDGVFLVQSNPLIGVIPGDKPSNFVDRAVEDSRALNFQAGDRCRPLARFTRRQAEPHGSVRAQAGIPPPAAPQH